MEHIFLTGILWPKEASDKDCYGPAYGDVRNQRECQEKCEHANLFLTCKGIIYNNKTGYTHYCALCRTDNLDVGWDNFGFYRRPTGKDISYIS